MILIEDAPENIVKGENSERMNGVNDKQCEAE
jgi:hypothetical protein